MILNTHLTISNALIENLDSSKSFFISEKNFIYGNIKPDMTSKYVLHKHYLKESFDMIIGKIKSLCKLSLVFIEKYFSISKFSQELGVICHFLCDFFCVPHSQRWEFSHSFKKHVIYEKDLQSIAKDTNFKTLEKASNTMNIQNNQKHDISFVNFVHTFVRKHGIIIADRKSVV